MSSRFSVLSPNFTGVKKYEQLASLKIIVSGDIPYFLEGMEGDCNEPYKSEDLSDGEIYQFENFNLSIDGLKKVDYSLYPLTIASIKEGIGELHLGLKFNNILGFSEDHASDAFEELFIPEGITISDFTFTDENTFITSNLKVVEIVESEIDDLAVAMPV